MMKAMMIESVWSVENDQARMELRSTAYLDFEKSKATLIGKGKVLSASHEAREPSLRMLGAEAFGPPIKGFAPYWKEVQP